MKKLSGKTANLLLAVLELAVGILLLADPAKFVMGIIIGAGILLLGFAVFCIIKYFFTPAEEAAQGQLFLMGAVSFIGGMICIMKKAVIFGKFKWLVLLCGIAVLVLGIGKVQKTIDMLRLKMDRWLFQGISALLSLALGAVIVFNPFGTDYEAFWKFAGIALIVASSGDIVAFVATLIKKKAAEPDVIEANGEEVKEEE